MKKILYIVGGNSTALEIREIFDQYYSNDYALIYNVIGDDENTSLTNVIRDSELEAHLTDKSEIYFIIGVTNIRLKDKFRSFFTKHAGIETNCIHPKSYISPSAQLGKGIYIAAFSVVSSKAKVGDGTFININVSVGHDSIIGKDCCLNPGVRISGHVSVGNATLIGANSCVFQGKSIGINCAIDAMTYIERNIEDAKMCTCRMGGLRIYNNCNLE